MGCKMSRSLAFGNNKKSMEDIVQRMYMAKVCTVFDKADKDGSGDVDRKELQAALDKDDELKSMLAKAKRANHHAMEFMDRNNDKAITKGEFMSYVMEDYLEVLYDTVDTSQDGKVSKEELVAKLKADKDVKHLMDMIGGTTFYLFEQVDSNDDGSISKEEWVKFLEETRSKWNKPVETYKTKK